MEIFYRYLCECLYQHGNHLNLQLITDLLSTVGLNAAGMLERTERRARPLCTRPCCLQELN